MNKRIMIIDDDEDIRELMASSLEEEGYKVIVASDGNNALRTLAYLDEHTLPACIILDLMMPGLDGVDVFEHIRQKTPHVGLRNIPIIFSTGVEISPEEIQKSRNVHLLQKPFNLDQLWDLIEIVFGAAREDNLSPPHDPQVIELKPRGPTKKD